MTPQNRAAAPSLHEPPLSPAVQKASPCAAPGAKTQHALNTQSSRRPELVDCQVNLLLLGARRSQLLPSIDVCLGLARDFSWRITAPDILPTWPSATLDRTFIISILQYLATVSLPRRRMRRPARRRLGRTIDRQLAQPVQSHAPTARQSSTFQRASPRTRQNAKRSDRICLFATPPAEGARAPAPHPPFLSASQKSRTSTIHSWRS